jgi:lipase chaperone LimK
MVDQEHAAWMQRLQNYRNAKDGILRQSALSAQAKDLMVKDLERSQFSAEELREVQILESIRAQNGQAGRAARSG